MLSKLTEGKFASSRVAHWFSDDSNGCQPRCFRSFFPIIVLVTSITGRLGFLTAISMVWTALWPFPSAETVTFAVPSPMASRENLTSSSPGEGKRTDALSSPVIATGPSTETLTSAPLTSSSNANTLTGRVTFSPVPRTLGRVGRTIRGDLTGTVFSAFPYMASPPATTMTLTLPTYIGSLTLCVAEPDCRVKGPRNLTTGLKRLSFFAPTITSSSPPMLNIGENRPE